MAEQPSKLANLPFVVKKGIFEALKELHTSMPGIIESFNTETQTARVQPAIRRIFKTNDGEKEILTPTDIPLLINVPVIFSGGGGYSVTFPLDKGDECLLIFAERSIDRWYKFGGVRDPGGKRFHSFSDAVAIPGLRSLPNVIESFTSGRIEIRNNDRTSFMSIEDDGTITITSNGEVNVNASTVNIDASTTNLGDGGQPIARQGDSVEVTVTSGSSAGTYNGTITGGGDNTSI
jgi:hypothetical protein